MHRVKFGLTFVLTSVLNFSKKFSFRAKILRANKKKTPKKFRTMTKFPVN